MNITKIVQHENSIEVHRGDRVRTYKASVDSHMRFFSLRFAIERKEKPGSALVCLGQLGYRDGSVRYLQPPVTTLEF